MKIEPTCCMHAFCSNDYKQQKVEEHYLFLVAYQKTNWKMI
jgi:hypothetical protein